ncbi:MAG: DNA starvation/stationary phase protection protein [Eubacteriales bacterium]|nr:DNA starvation/stationary phase protection protein [Eubacteriales bacterium]
MKNTMKKLDVYLADLFVGNVFLHNLHWNVVGPSFKTIHVFLEGLYDQNFEFVDSIAEIQKMFGFYPVGSMKQYLELTNVKECEKSEDIPQMECVKIARDYIAMMKKTALEVRESADEEGIFQIANMMEDQISEYDKQLWFMDSMLK